MYNQLNHQIHSRKSENLTACNSTTQPRNQKFTKKRERCRSNEARLRVIGIRRGWCGIISQGVIVIIHPRETVITKRIAPKFRWPRGKRPRRRLRLLHLRHPVELGMNSVDDNWKFCSASWRKILRIAILNRFRRCPSERFMEILIFWIRNYRFPFYLIISISKSRWVFVRLVVSDAGVGLIGICRVVGIIIGLNLL